MLGDVIIPMPTDLHSRISPLEIDSPPRKRTGILKLTVDVPTSSQPLGESRSLPRWSTPEFIFYFITAVVVIPIMVWIPISLSSSAYLGGNVGHVYNLFAGSHPNYPFYRSRLSRGWLFGREIVSLIPGYDFSDKFKCSYHGG
jgi:protein-cysteine N-palmitoyltransferase HHAT